MGRPGKKKVTLDDYFAEWDSERRVFRITPKKSAGGRQTTPTFGLGDATIRLNVGHLPEKILKQITGESKNTRLLPVDTTHLNRWEVAIASIGIVRKEVVGFKKRKATLKYPEARGFSLYHYENVVDIKPNGRVPVYPGDGSSTNFAEVWDPPSGAQASVTPMGRDGTFDVQPDNRYLATVKNGKVDVYMRSMYGEIYWIGSIGTAKNGAVPVEVAVSDTIHWFRGPVKVRFSDGTARRYVVAYTESKPREYDPKVFPLDPLDYDPEYPPKGVARITAHGEYYATRKFYKTGQGNTGVAQFLSNKKDQNFIISVIEGQYGDVLIVAEEGRMRVIFPSGASKVFAGDTPIAKVFFSSAGEFVVTGTEGDYVMHQIVKEGKGLRIPCEDCGFISLFQTPITKVVASGYSDAPPVGGQLKTYGKWSFVPSIWSGSGETGHVVGDNREGGWWHLDPAEEGGALQFMEAPYYVVDGKTHILKCESTNYPFYGPGKLVQKDGYYSDPLDAAVKLTITAEEGHEALDTIYSASPNDKVNLSALDAKYFISGEMVGIFFNYGDNPRVKYGPGNVDRLYWR